MTIDLLTTVEYGGCSAKLSPTVLAEVLSRVPAPHHPNLLVDISTHDDAGVYKLTDEIALVQTTDFFTPICSDPYEFGQIAAANALSDVYAMGGTPLTALNIVMFPTATLPIEALTDILRGGADKIREAGAVVVGGHTIEDSPPKYGCAITGTVHPQRIITNAAARPGECLILTKPIGSGIVTAGHRLGETSPADYRCTLDTMKLLNKAGGELMQKFGICCATDVTGFGLAGHALKMAQAGKVTLHIKAAAVPLLPGAYALADLGCLPGAAFRNLTFIEPDTQIETETDYNLRMILCDAQTSGGLLMCVPEEKCATLLEALQTCGYPHSAIIGEVLAKAGYSLMIS